MKLEWKVFLSGLNLGFIQNTTVGGLGIVSIVLTQTEEMDIISILILVHPCEVDLSFSNGIYNTTQIVISIYNVFIPIPICAVDTNTIRMH